MNNSLVFVSEITSTISKVATSLPISIYFLGFLNYFAMSSLYVLLNFPIPEQIYKFLALLYEELNSDFMSIFGVEIEIAPFSD